MCHSAAKCVEFWRLIWRGPFFSLITTFDTISYETRDMKKTDELSWKKFPVKTLCYKIHDAIPTIGDKKNAKGGYLYFRAACSEDL